MGPRKDCLDIVTHLGGIKDLDAAQQVFKAKLDASNLRKLEHIQNPDVLIFLKLPEI